MEKKYTKLKKILKEFQQREADLLHREEYYLQVLQEKDTEYNALVKALKDRVSKELNIFYIDKYYLCRYSYLNGSKSNYTGSYVM